ncbi:MAG: efflux RND transporter permease subunit, partial [Muribaculaceae bacterium]|nr:efflux RND transporter permease subunit [Muribaculaceae bacterium]
MKWVEYLVSRTTLMWSLIVGVLIAGVLAFLQMAKLEDPAVPVKQAIVVVVRPGATVHEMELQVAIPAEDILRTLPDVRKLKTDCKQGMVSIAVEFEMTVLLKDLEQHFDQLRRKVNDMQSSLPEGCVATVVVDDEMDVYGIFYALQGDGYTYSELNDYAKMIRRNLVAIKGVKRVKIVGNREEVVNIVLDKQMITANGVLPTQIMLALQDVGKPVNAGKISADRDNEKLAVRVDTMICTVDDIRDLYLPTLDGKRIRLGDVAKVERAYSEPQTNGFFVRGKPALAICVAMENDVIVPDVGKVVDAKLAEVLKTMPVGITTEKIFFQPDKVTSAINSFMLNLVESVIVVILLLVFTMGWRSGAIIGFGLILTISASFP